MLKTIVLLLFLVACNNADDLPMSSEDLDKVPAENPPNNGHEIKEKGLELHRNKRGWRSVIFSLTSNVARYSIRGLTLAVALSDGCVYYPSICRNRDKLKKLEKNIKNISRQYEQSYGQARKAYYDLKTAAKNNAYISYYINNTIETVDALQDVEEQIVAQLEEKLQTVSSINNLTFSEQYLNLAVKLEYELSQIRKMVFKMKKNALLEMAVNAIVETILKKFSRSFMKAYHQVDLYDLRPIAYKHISGRFNVITYIKNKLARSMPKLKLVPKAFKQMAKNFWQRFRNFGNNVKKLGQIKSWNDLKGKFAYLFEKPITKLKNVMRFIREPTVRTKFVKEYRLSWTSTATNVLGITTESIIHYLTVKNYEELATKLERTRANYETYYDGIQTDLIELNNCLTHMAEEMMDTVEIFKNMSLTFKNLINDVSQYIEFSDVVGHAGLPVDTSAPLFTINFDRVTRQSLRSNQIAVKGFLQSVDNNMTQILDQMKARLVLYENTKSKSEGNESITNILSDVSDILKFSPSTTMRKYGSKLTSKDLVCTVSILRNDILQYDFFPLQPFRPRCEVNAYTFETYRTEALKKRKSKLMRQIVIDNIHGKKNESLSKLADAVHNAYFGVRDEAIKSFGRSVTDADIICMIATEFQSKQRYDLINLTSFRPDCSAVTASAFNKLIADAQKLRQLSGAIQNSLTTCQNYKFCPCLSHVASQNKVTETDVENILKQLDPNWQPNAAVGVFCGPTECECKHL